MITTAWPTAEQPAWGIFVQRQAEGLRARGVDVDVLHILGYRSTLAYLLAARELVSLNFDRPAYRIVHAQSGEAACVSWLYRRAPILTTYIGSDILGFRRADGTQPGVARLRARLVRMTAALSDATVTQSDEMHRAMPQWVRSKDRVLLNGVDFSLFRPMPRDEARRALGWPADGHVALFAAPPEVPLKRHALAVAAVQDAKRTIPGLRLEVADRVPPGMMPTMMAASDCLLHPSASEGSPNVVKEAMACNLPVVATAVGDIPQLLAGVRNSAVCEASATNLGAGLVACLNCGERSNGRDYQARFDQERVLDELQSLYRQLSLSQPSPVTDPLTDVQAAQIR